MSKNSSIAFWLFTLSIAFALTLPVLIQDGMFMDAMLYTSVSHNMSQGMGSFWFPYFDEYNVVGLTSFHEQPPLVFYIQSLFFKALGSSLYVERLYTFFTFCVNTFLIHTCWKMIWCNNEKIRSMSWLAVLLWIGIPICFWSYSNNMHENTMSMFVLLSVITCYGALQNNTWYGLVTSALCACLAFLCKGFPGLFTIGIPFLYWIFFKTNSFSKMTLQTLVMITTIVIVALVLYFNKTTHQSIFINYLEKRVFQRINEAHTVGNRLFVFGRLFSELIPHFILGALLFCIVQHKKMTYMLTENWKIGLFIFCIGLCGSLPLALTKVQKGFYMVASLPYFGIAFACWFSPIVYYFLPKADYKKLRWMSAFLLLLVLIFTTTKIGGISRDKEILHDVYAIGKIVSKDEYLQVANQTIYSDYEFQCYLMRYFNVGIRRGKASYFIVEKNTNVDSLHYRKIEIPTVKYDLYKE